MRLLPILFALPFEVLGQSTWPLPLYERWDGSSLLISRDTLEFDSLWHAIDTVTAFGPHGRQYLRVSNVRVVDEDECCTDDDPRFMLLVLEEPVVMDPAYVVFMPGVVPELGAWPGRPVDAGSVMRDTLTWSNNNGRRTEYCWSPDSISGLGLRVRDFDERGEMHYDRTFATPRSRCSARAWNDLTAVRCMRDTAQAASIWGATFLFLFDHDRLVQQFWDFSGTSADGYGPFAYSRYEICAMMERKDGVAYVLTSGQLVVQDARGWTVIARDPVRYYGECDCGE